MTEEIKAVDIPDKRPAHYVDNKEFYAAIVEFNEARLKDPKHPISDYLGRCIMDISYRIAFRPNFINYSYRDEMQEDALENCLRCINQFDHVKYKNPFGYFSQIAWYAAIRRIQKEQTQMEAKANLVQSGMLYHDTIAHIDADSDHGDYFDPEALSSLEHLYHYKVRERVKKPKVVKPPTEYNIRTVLEEAGSDE
jgi:hypothetical protein